MRTGFLAMLFGMVVATAGHAEDALPPAQQLAAEIARGEHSGVEAFILQVEGQILARTVAPKLAKRPPDLRSATKSITSLLVGIALDRRELSSVETKVVDLLPARRAAFSKDARKAAMTLEDLLTMRSGLACDDWDPASPGFEDKMYATRDWVGFWSEQPMRDRAGERFSYCTGNVIAIGEILATATGLAADELARKYLFEPLGITKAQWAHWNGKRGVDTGGHLRLAPDDLLKIGDLVLHRGMHGTQRIVSESWINAMTQARTTIPERTQQYGYLWWLDRTKDPKLPQTDLWWAQGNGGNLLIVMPGVSAVLVVTGTRFNKPEQLEPMFWLRDRLLPAMHH